MRLFINLFLWILVANTFLLAGNTLKKVEIKNGELQLVFSTWLNTNTIHQMTLSNPPRQVIDIKDTTLANGVLGSAIAANGVKSFRIAQRDGNVVRIVIETQSDYSCKGNQPMASRLFYRIPLPKSNGDKQPIVQKTQKNALSSQPVVVQSEPLVIEKKPKTIKSKIEKDEQTEVDPGMQEVQEAKEVREIPEKKPSFFASLFSSSKKSTSCASKLKSTYTIVIDAGHGGHDSGAVGEKKYYEKNIVLAIAKRTEKHLRKMDFKVKMTRSGDNFVDLKKRTKYANQQKADIFVSVHANAIANKSKFNSIYGVETYFLQTTRNEKSKRIAALENSVVLDKNDFLSQNVILEAVLNGPKIELSHKLAIDIQSKILGNARQKYNGVQDGGVRPAPFWVLVGAQMPSVLVETGYVSNPTECRRLANADYQDRVAKGIAEGIYNYLLLREKAMY